MTMTLPWMLAAALAAAGVEDAAVDFPCDRLSDATVEVYDGLEDLAAPARGAVNVVKKAVLFERRQALVAGLFSTASPRLASAGGALAPVLFRKYRSGTETFLCTQTRNQALFGAGDDKVQFLLRCLVDGDGDGSYDSFVHKLALVPFSMRTGRATGPAQQAPGILKLPLPLTLVPAAAPVQPDPFSKVEIRTRISVARVSGGNVEIRFSGGVRRGPDSMPDLMDRAETIVSVPMTEGAEVPLLGTRIRFARRGGKWTAEVLDGFGRQPRLLCSGAVVEAGDTFTVLTPGGQSTFARADIRR